MPPHYREPMALIGDAAFRDLNHNGVLDPYEDARLSPEERTTDLLGRLSLAEKVGLMFHTVIETGPNGTVLENVAESVRRAGLGEVDHLAVCPPSGLPVATGGVDYTKTSVAATLWQLSVDEALRSCGIGTVLIQALEGGSASAA